MGWGLNGFYRVIPVINDVANIVGDRFLVVVEVASVLLVGDNYSIIRNEELQISWLATF